MIPDSDNTADDAQRADRRLGSDDRGASEVIGAILVFGLVVTLIALLQLTAVPAWNAGVEYQHNEQVQQQFQHFDDAVSRTAATGQAQSITIKPGTDYPQRAFLINPGPATGTLRTSAPADVTIGNVEAVDGEVADYLTGSLTFEARALVHEARYNQYDRAPVTNFTTSLVLNEFDDGDVIVKDEGSVVSGTRISLVVLNGSLATSKVAPVSLETQPLSVSRRSVTVTSQDANPLTIQVPSELAPSTWEDEILAEEMDTGTPASPNPNDGRYVLEVVDGASDGLVEIRLEANANYTLRIAMIGVGDDQQDPAPAYVVPGGETTKTVSTNQSVQLTAAARDELTNPVAGAEITFVARRAGEFSNGKSRITVPTDDVGDAVVHFQPERNGTTTIVAGFDADNDGNVTDDPVTGGPAPEKNYTKFTVQRRTGVIGNVSGGFGRNLNPSKGVVLTGAEAQGKCINVGDSCTVAVTLENRASFNATIDELRVSFFSNNAISQSEEPFPDSVALSNTSWHTLPTDYFNIGPNKIKPGNDREYRFTFYKNGNKEFPVNRGDFFVVSVIFENGGSATYFIAPDAPSGASGGGGGGGGNN